MNKIFKDIKNLVQCYYSNNINESDNQDNSNNDKRFLNTSQSKIKSNDFNFTKDLNNESVNYLDSLKELQRTFLESNKEPDNIFSRKSSFQTFENETLVKISI